jgi:translation initiation factor IF-3
MSISKPFDRTPVQDQYRVNRRIRVPEVRVIGADGSQLGVLRTDEALRIAEEGGHDLVEVSPKAMPPVCKIMDYGKFKYENSKKAKDARKHQSTVTLKEIKFRPKTDDHDFDFKVKHIRRFLLEGNKAKLVVIFRGREIVHPETGQDVLKRVVEVTNDIAQVEQTPMMEGRRMLMIIAPRSGVIRAATPPGMSPPATAPAAPRPILQGPTVPIAPSPTGAAPAPKPAATPAPTAPTTAPAPASAPKPAPAATAPKAAPSVTTKPASKPQPQVSAKPPTK